MGFRNKEDANFPLFLDGDAFLIYSRMASADRKKGVGCGVAYDEVIQHDGDLCL